jgi:hypothetical protein
MTHRRFIFSDVVVYKKDNFKHLPHTFLMCNNFYPQIIFCLLLLNKKNFFQYEHKYRMFYSYQLKFIA